ncbi:ABC transporter ATP-binding protein [Proteiniclasticum sp. SCR006]|uniref:ABC transporter ATP-binding protein n=1 Tax=Proteiniclasticum aestuarii TaxID=2817862 RepID=A0A939KGE0_9CLOT|nr:ABC transporter ATP-binding protein [Proteiniclasticum aestuarii]MBO1265422.1 ABC transporter ATP-binding protein [Proteiniclasticum aestuarii]
MIKLSNVSYQYDNSKTETLKDINLELERGEVLAIVGPSGGGKSTLLRVIAGLEKPKAGEMFLGSECIYGNGVFVKPEDRGIGMLFQDYALFPHMTVAKNIEYGLIGMKSRERKKRMKEVLELVNLAEYERRYPHELSGGQQQRIALARAIAPMPKILLLDEPFSNLDTFLLQSVREELFGIIRAIGITAIMVTHNPEDAKTQADRVIQIIDGIASESRYEQ